jgi:hypothetical protein
VTAIYIVFYKKSIALLLLSGLVVKILSLLSTRILLVGEEHQQGLKNARGSVTTPTTG